MPSPDFVLGCERSGSTWVANTLDAHPETEVYLEPFADYAQLFPRHPGRFHPLEPDGPDAAQIDELQRVFERLPHLRHPFFYRPGRATAWRHVDAACARAIAGWARLRGASPPLSLLRHRLLDLHTSQTPTALLVRKTARSRVRIVKELRLAFQAGLIRRAFPSARCLIVVRDPGAQVTSVRRLFEREHLGELRRALVALREALASSGRLHRYRGLCDALVDDPATPEALLVWWLVSYDVLISDCERLGLAHRVVFHEELARDPRAEAGALLEFFGLEPSEQVERYVAVSSSRDHCPDAPLSTLRDSAAHSARTRAAASPELRRRARALIEQYAESEALRRYASASP
jgi:Sulfotransferase family